MNGWLVSVLASAFVVTVSIGVRSRHKRSGRSVGFREYVRNPSLQREMAKVVAARNLNIQQLTQLPPDQLVEHLLDDESHDVVARAIKFVGSPTIPSLIAAVTNRAFRRQTDPAKQNKLHVFVRRTEPLETVLDCLEDVGAQSAVSTVATLTQDPNKEVRKHAAMFLGSTGSDSAVAGLRRSLSDADDYVRSFAMMGVLRAIKDGRATKAFSAGVFDAVQPLVWRRANGHAAECLLALDRDRAVSVLTAPGVLTSQPEGLHNVLDALGKAEVAVDEEALLAIADARWDRTDQYPNEYVIGAALKLLVASKSDAALAALERGLTSSSNHVRQRASDALAARAGLKEPYAIAFKRLEQSGWSGLPDSVRAVLAVRMLIDEVNNGGFSQYFVNSSGDQWKDALSGLEAIGLEPDIAIMKQALSFFGPEGPSEQRDKRHKQLARIVSRGDDVFASLESDFYKDKDDREVRLMQFMMKHPEHFRAA